MADNRLAFGSALRDLRMAKGLQQQEIAQRIPHRYSSDRSYRRAESGDRLPDRDTVIDIVVRGLLESNPDTVNRMLSLAGYLSLSAAESEKLQLAPVAASVGQSHQRPVLSAAIVTALVAASVATAFNIRGLPMWFVLLTSGLYAALYGVSLLLESRYGTTASGMKCTVWYVCGGVFVTSVAALALLSALARAGGSEGLWLALAIFVITAAIQWIASRLVLSSEPVVELTFSSHTAQAAHLKNTLYFLTAVVFFWVPPAHSLLCLDRELALGSRQSIARVLEGHGLSNGLLHPKPAWLWGLLLFIIGVTLLMGSRLLDSLRPNPNRNDFLVLFYLRALLYFCLAFTCVLWYSVRLDGIERLVFPSP